LNCFYFVNWHICLMGCTRLRAVSGILRTQRGRRGSGGVRLRAGTVSAGPAQCGRSGLDLHRVCLSPLWLKSASRPCGSTLAGVGHRPLANGRGCLVGLRVWVLDRRPVSPLSSSPACSGAGSGRHLRTQIAVGTVMLGGLATDGASPLLCADSWAVTVRRIASAARLRQSRGHRTERGQPVSHQHGTTAVALSAKFGVRGVPARPLPGRGR
jgi:hypothetical protein